MHPPRKRYQKHTRSGRSGCYDYTQTRTRTSRKKGKKERRRRCWTLENLVASTNVYFLGLDEVYQVRVVTSSAWVLETGFVHKRYS